MCLLDLDYNLPVQVRDSATGKELEDLPESDVNKEYVLQRLAEDGDLDSSYNKQRADDTILKLQRTTPYYKVSQPFQHLAAYCRPGHLRWHAHCLANCIYVCCRGTGLQSAVSLLKENASEVLNVHIGMRCQALASLQSRTSRTGRPLSCFTFGMIPSAPLHLSVTLKVCCMVCQPYSACQSLQVLWSE